MKGKLQFSLTPDGDDMHVCILGSLQLEDSYVGTYCITILFWRRKWQPTPVHLLGKSHGWRSLVGYSPWGHKESDTTERLHFHFTFKAGKKKNVNH